jgi:hypothetical protein
MVTVGLKIGDGVLNPTLGKPMYNYSIRNRIFGSQAYSTPPPAA